LPPPMNAAARITRVRGARLGQGIFRMRVVDAYGRACAVTQEHSLPVLEAAHIKPFAQEGPHSVNNGLLLRADLHRLYDTGYMTVTADLEVRVSESLMDDFHNGREYLRLAGRRITVPGRAQDMPDRELLGWHADEVFRDEAGKGTNTRGETRFVALQLFSGVTAEFIERSEHSTLAGTLELNFARSMGTSVTV